MAIFNNYVKFTEGIQHYHTLYGLKHLITLQYISIVVLNDDHQYPLVGGEAMVHCASSVEDTLGRHLVCIHCIYVMMMHYDSL